MELIKKSSDILENQNNSNSLLNLNEEDYSKSFSEVEDFNASHIFVEDDPALIAAKKAFHVKYLFPWQRLVISNILDSYKDQHSPEVKALEHGEDVEITDAFCLGRQIVLLPTGAGKSMCFLVPSIMLPGPTLIIYPLLALMSDQERRMKDGSIEAVTFRGGQSDKEREENFKKIDNGAKIILANPEVLKNESLVQRLKKCNISHIAIDEAHCVSEWGDSFRPAYLELGKVIETLDIKIVTAFTATASPKVLSRIAEVLFNNNAHIVRSESDRPNIHYFVKYVYSKPKAVFELCKTEPRPILVFCGTRNKAEEMAKELRSYFNPDDVGFYHAGLTREEKSKVEKWYFPHKNAILCSTCAFGMGVDKSDIRTVIHLEASTTAESYIQEAGRGGRDRSVANAILLWSYDDSRRFDEFPIGARERVIKNFAEATTCRRQVLLDALGGEQAVCEGCDVCLSKSKEEKLKSLKDAPDRNKVLGFIKFHSKEYTFKQLVPVVKEKINKDKRKLFGKNVWTQSDVKLIISQLEKEGSIKKAGFWWKDRLMYVKKGDVKDITF